MFETIIVPVWMFIKSVIHNCLHVVLPFLPRDMARFIHERNALWAYGKEGPFNGLD